MSPTKRKRKYVIIWEQHHGPLPKPCTACGQIIFVSGRHKGEGLVHHKDHDHDNDDPTNLVLLCVGCHFREHLTGVPKSAKARKLMAEKSRGHLVTEEMRESYRQAQQARAARDEYNRGFHGQFVRRPNTS